MGIRNRVVVDREGIDTIKEYCRLRANDFENMKHDRYVDMILNLNLGDLGNNQQNKNNTN